MPLNKETKETKIFLLHTEWSLRLNIGISQELEITSSTCYNSAIGHIYLVLPCPIH